MPKYQFLIGPEQRAELFRMFTEDTQAPCPYSKDQIDQMIDLAVHAVNETAATVERVTAMAPSPMVANALAWRMLMANADTYIEASRALSPGTNAAGQRIVPTDEGDCDCPGCSMRRALMEQGAETIDLGNGITAIVVDPKTLN